MAGRQSCAAHVTGDKGIYRQRTQVAVRSTQMQIRKRPFLIAMCFWVICFLPLLALVFGDPVRAWSEGLLVWVTTVVISGLAVVGLVALLCRNVDKAEGAARGCLCGIAPLALILAWIILGEPGIAAAGAVVFALLYAIPGAVGGALAGIIYSSQNRMPT